ncbi:MAG: hypothetical protein DWQ48_07455 [Bacteroidetes bacterium]|nr:MAG: hypothetical protein DWQ48_07455 [Bacteroidota bacterium]
MHKYRCNSFVLVAFRSIFIFNIVMSCATSTACCKAGAFCFYESDVLNSSFVHPMKYRAKNPCLR